MKKYLLALLMGSIAANVTAQDDDLLKKLEDSSNHSIKVSGAFKSTRVINAHSLEMLRKGTLDTRILHRFGLVNNGIDQLFGLDQASMRLGFDYGISNNLMVGFGRSTLRKELDLFVKARLLQQSTGQKAVPLSVLIAAGMLVTTQKTFSNPEPGFSDRSSWYIQLIAGRKFSDRFSMQLSPIFVYANTPFNSKGDKSQFAPGIGARYKINKRLALTIDYHYPVMDMDSAFSNPLSVGLDIETGGHVFQLHFSNAAGMNERAYINETTGDFLKGDIRFGFNLSRIFQVAGKKKRLTSY